MAEKAPDKLRNMQERRARWRRLGLCSQCGREREFDKLATCKRCQSKSMQRQRRAKMKAMHATLPPEETVSKWSGEGSERFRHLCLVWGVKLDE